MPRDPVLLLRSPDATAALQHLTLKRGNRRSPRTTSPNMQTAPCSRRTSRGCTRHGSCLADGLRAIHSSTPHRISSTSHIHSPARYRRTRRNSCRSATAERSSRRSYSGSNLHPLLLDFHRVLHARETHSRVPSHDRAHLVYRPEQNRRPRSAPNLDCDPCGSSVGCDLLRRTYGMSAPWPTAFVLGAPLSAPHLHCYHCWNLRLVNHPS